MTRTNILVVAADPAKRARLAEILRGLEHEVEAVAAAPAVDGTWHGIVYAVASLADAGWRALAGRREGPPMVVLAEQGDVRDAVTAMRAGVKDFQVGELDPKVLQEALPVASDRGDRLIADDPAMGRLIELATRVAAKGVSVLLTGESGTGKELMARHIHERSPRADSPFVAVNCAAIPETMLEAVLFGFEKGAFTGAHRSHAGKFEQAEGGTLLLDEISEVDPGLQAKLLRVLQEREVERLCGARPVPLDVRVIATTNRDLRAMVREGTFREDLYYRLHVFPLHIPPLRERRGDILPLARSFVARHGSGRLQLTAEAEQRLLDHDWPGNVRELENVIQRAAILAEDEVDADAVRFDDVTPMSVPRAELPQAEPHLEAEVRSSEQRVILDTLQRVNGSRKAAAERLGISDRTLRYKLARMRRDGFRVPTRFGAECA